MKKALLIVVLGALALGVYALSNAAQAQQAEGETAKAAIDPEHEQAIRKLLEATGVQAQAKQSMQMMIDNFKRTMPQVPAEFWDKFMAKVDMDEFVGMMVPIYAKHLTKEDVKGLVEFYQTPLGKRLIEAQPKISAEAMQVGMAWGQKLANQVVQELKNQQAQPAPVPDEM